MALTGYFQGLKGVAEGIKKMKATERQQEQEKIANVSMKSGMSTGMRKQKKPDKHKRFYTMLLMLPFFL